VIDLLDGDIVHLDNIDNLTAVKNKQRNSWTQSNYVYIWVVAVTTWSS